MFYKSCLMLIHSTATRVCTEGDRILLVKQKSDKDEFVIQVYDDV